jgi:hypothetical protein
MSKQWSSLVGITIKTFKIVPPESKMPHPWVSVYDRSSRTEPDPTRELERRYWCTT